MSSNQSFQIVLGSSSPRRRELLAMVTPDFTVIKPETAEVPRPGEPAEDYVVRNAREKAEWIADATNTDQVSRLIISADTIVVHDGVILEKPIDAPDAVRMLSMLSNTTHRVVTGVHLIAARSGDRPRAEQRRVAAFVVATEVTFKALTRAEIDFYIATGEPFDKAGGYAAQGRGSWFVKRVNGSWSNVVGLPMAELVTAAEREFGIVLWKQA